jgi:hypothetical protein
LQRSTFEVRLHVAARRAVSFARAYVWQELPEEMAFLVYPNQSHDGHPRVGDERVFPADSLPRDRCHGPWSADEAVAFLWRDGQVPEWINVAVQVADGRRTLVGLRCCGRFTAQADLLYHQHYEAAVPPFSIISPVLPPGWERVEESGKFDLHWRGQPRPMHPVAAALRRIVNSWLGGPRSPG